MGEDETLAVVVRDIAGKLERWRGLKEAQTTQAIILRVLQALGWNIWNPYEVVPQDTGTKNYRPDFLLCVKKDEPVLVLEVKALDKTLTDEDRMQVVNYANSQNIRWSVLTNGKLWEFFDNRVEAKAPEKRVLYFQLDNPSAAKYLDRLLSKAFWEGQEPPATLSRTVEEIRREIETQQSLTQIKEKLSKALAEGYQPNERGLQKAIEKELSANEQELALAHFERLLQEILDVSANCSPILKLNALLVQKEQSFSRNSPGLIVWFGEERFRVPNWRELYAAVVETGLQVDRLEKTEAMRKLLKEDLASSRTKKSGTPYKKSAFKKLPSGEYLFVHLSAKRLSKKIKEVLNLLEVPSSALRIEYQGRQFTLP
jgi:hypothetical protein